jgi:hypothetical protein
MGKFKSDRSLTKAPITGIRPESFALSFAILEPFHPRLDK